MLVGYIHLWINFKASVFTSTMTYTEKIILFSQLLDQKLNVDFQ